MFLSSKNIVRLLYSLFCLLLTIEFSYAQNTILWMNGTFSIDNLSLQEGDTIPERSTIHTKDTSSYLLLVSNKNNSLQHIELFGQTKYEITPNIYQHKNNKYIRYVLQELQNKCLNYKIDNSKYIISQIPAILPSENGRVDVYGDTLIFWLNKQITDHYDSCQINIFAYDDLDHPSQIVRLKTHTGLCYLNIQEYNETNGIWVEVVGISQKERHGAMWDEVKLYTFPSSAFLEPDDNTEFSRTHQQVLSQNFKSTPLSLLTLAIFFDKHGFYSDALRCFLLAKKVSKNHVDIQTFYEAFLQRHHWLLIAPDTDF